MESMKEPKSMDSRISLRNAYINYFGDIIDLKCESRIKAFKFVIEGYIMQFESLYKIYSDLKRDVVVYYGRNKEVVEIYFSFLSTKREGATTKIIYNAKEQLETGTDCITILDDRIVIKKDFSIANFSIVQGIMDLAKITNQIEKAELEYLKTK